MSIKQSQKTNLKVWARRAGIELNDEANALVWKKLTALGLGESTTTAPMFYASRMLLNSEVPASHLNAAAYITARCLRVVLASEEGLNLLKEMAKAVKTNDDKIIMAMYSTEMLAVCRKLITARSDEKVSNRNSMAEIVLAKVR